MAWRATEHDARTRPGARKRRQIRKVGFFGCARGGQSGVVRVMLRRAPDHRYPTKIRLACPACKHEHDAHPFWRAYEGKLDDGKDYTLV